MQFQKNTRAGTFSTFSKILIKLVLLTSILFFIVILIDKINFPSPNKMIERSISNERFKVIK